MPTKPTKQKPTSTHHMGKSSGYDLIDGKYHLAPMHVSSMQALNDERKAMNLFLGALNDHLKRNFRELAIAERRWWESVGDDLGVDFLAGSYSYSCGVISPIEDKKEPTNEKA